MPVTLTPALAPKETGGSPEFPGYPSEHMPRSQTPVVFPPLALARSELLPSGRCRPSALGPFTRTYPLTTIIHFSGFNNAACALALPLLRTSLLSDRPSVRLSTRWLALGRVGFCGFHRITHWVTTTIFKGLTLFHHPVLLSARAAHVSLHSHLVTKSNFSVYPLIISSLEIQ
jgi:hypothetical protein